jgi:hypothetical protein
LEYDSAAYRAARRSLREFGVGFWRDSYESVRYCGSLLPALADRVGTNEWTDRAFIRLLDEGWSTDCGGTLEGVRFGNYVFVPVIRRGEAFLKAYPASPLWPSVALRVALAHETAWSVTSTLPWANEFDYRDDPEVDRQRAVELYKAIRPRARGVQLAAAIDRKIRMMEAGTDTKCRVYWREGH